MTEKPITLDNCWEDGVCYKAEQKRYDIYKEDTVCADDARYFIKGHKDPLNTAFYIKGRKNITLDFDGATVVLHGKLQPFLIDECENVTIKNVSILYDRCPYTQGTVVEADGSTLKLKIGEAFPYRVEDGEMIIASETWENRDLDKAPMFMQFFDGETHQGVGIYLAIYGKNPSIDPSLPWAKSTLCFDVSEEDGLLVLTRKGGSIPPVEKGMIAVIAHEARNLSGIQMVCCKNVSLINDRIMNGTGMGIFPFHCENLLLDGIKMTCDEQSPSIIANAADGIHAFACSGDFIIRNSVVEGVIDDALNIHSNFYTVKSAEGKRIVADTGLEPVAETPLFLPGDKIRVYQGYTMNSRADYTITAVRVTGDKTVELTVDAPVCPMEEHDAIENLSTQCRLSITDCRFAKANTHLRFQTRGDVLIENCETELPFLLTGDMTYWFESSPCEHFTVKNTRFSHENAIVRVMPEFVPTQTAPYYHGDLCFENCSFAAEMSIKAAYTRKISMKNCENAFGKPMTARLLNCGEDEIENCAVVRQWEEKHELKVN